MQFHQPRRILPTPCRQIHGYHEQMSPFERDRTVGLKGEKWSHHRIARHLDRTFANIQRCWQEWCEP
ncbi:hypothetical protein TNCV_779771 [Trichonephila clavipes]|nr:hypothetical protein TNCV_779771 [Trichonephila clavipes]